VACDSCVNLRDQLNAVLEDRAKYIDALQRVFNAWKVEKERADTLAMELARLSKTWGQA